jgi:hypothetical protein
MLTQNPNMGTFGKALELKMLVFWNPAARFFSEEFVQNVCR